MLKDNKITRYRTYLLPTFVCLIMLTIVTVLDSHSCIHSFVQPARQRQAPTSNPYLLFRGRYSQYAPFLYCFTPATIGDKVNNGGGAASDLLPHTHRTPPYPTSSNSSPSKGFPQDHPRRDRTRESSLDRGFSPPQPPAETEHRQKSSAPPAAV